MVAEIKEYFQKVYDTITDCTLFSSTYDEAKKYSGSDIVNIQIIKKHIALIEDAIIQNELHTEIALLGFLPEISTLLKEFRSYSAQIDFAGIQGEKDAFVYLQQVNHNFITFITLLKERCQAHGIELPDLTEDSDQTTWPEQSSEARQRPCFQMRMIGDAEARQKTLKKLHMLLDGRKGRYVALVIQCAINNGLICRPTFPELVEEFGITGNKSGYNKYTDHKFTLKETGPIIEHLKGI